MTLRRTKMNNELRQGMNKKYNKKEMHASLFLFLKILFLCQE